MTTMLVEQGQERNETSGWRAAPASYPIRRMAVLGAGTMGARIAAQIANAGYPGVCCWTWFLRAQRGEMCWQRRLLIN